MLVRLLYASRAASPPIRGDELAAILRTSTTNNARLGVTGLLCHSDRIYLQVLEGGRAPVSALYNRIAQDPRHDGVMLLGYEEITERSFAGWSMGQANVSRLNPALVLKYSETTSLDPHALSAGVALALLRELVETASVVCLD